MRLVIVALAVALCAGCSNRPVGVLTPVEAAAPDATEVDLLVATTREASNDSGTLYTGERGAGVSLDAFTVSIPPDSRRQIGEVQWPRSLPPNPETDFATLAVKPLPNVKAARGWLDAHLPPSRRVLIFVHGFNNRFEDAVYRFAQIVHDSGSEVAPVLFTWPSRARVFDYLFDRESTIFSRDAFEETVWQVASDPRVEDVTIMAHSMGAWLAMESLRQMAIRHGKLPAKIRNVILASPDVDVDVFASQWRALNGPQARFTLFVSQDDRALQVSRRIAGGVDRLGLIDVQKYYADLEKSGIVVIDLTAMRSGDSLNHGRFASSPEVVQLIGQRLVNGQTVTDSEISLGDRIAAGAMGVGQTVGGAAGLALSAPIAIIDPKTRRTYQSQVERFGQTVSETVEDPAAD
ncbi:alpha/beta hydrolase [Ancylobacter dichloromethanicus]|uniref:Lipoprotein n=1 Tax=Ancylobacter dichloromethanicus TaxID=518825 RepID=A0A9W6J8H8_9HYPH|nr:alpha/beta hydrolase [Ancylobacter dichloromethanicus]MBS7553643.1 alpha/beta hydrolase [Ancylobacter dichloromethanicus]GLK72707.1 lipoprotein [Ancylobacter dichloromethanicus]